VRGDDPAREATRPGRWVTVSELSEYAFCPRAHYYRAHPPVGGEAPESARDRARGVVHHARELSGERRIERAGPALVALGLLGLALLAAAALLLAGTLP
jgi:hypothetical protein